MKIFPVFKPNEYFWKNHWDESSGEQKWEAFARVVRNDLIAKSMNLELSDIAVEDKAEFKDIIKNKKPKEKTK